MNTTWATHLGVEEDYDSRGDEHAHHSNFGLFVISRFPFCSLSGLLRVFLLIHLFFFTVLKSQFGVDIGDLIRTGQLIVFLYLKQAPKPSPPVQSTSNKNRLLNHKVLARSEVDGFYYAGAVSRCLNSRYVEVDFRNFDRQVVPARCVIAMQGARPCPSLKVL